jgi:hypothetical protein
MEFEERESFSSLIHQYLQTGIKCVIYGKKDLTEEQTSVYLQKYEQLQQHHQTQSEENLHELEELYISIE